ncbi:MAG: tRNA (adenosine(37)-N6)-threonylcarbamoyltransferase complex dimerization subunit type 1 TsaB [Candidatus Edwardsbacteria bacterium]|nr:tRNA (adenosine(37)-N6)-threonylcarbamoyltransferase complex dimerization subunit type 1 TsaB [Candidatus Edwardsbacteria bacterium]
MNILAIDTSTSWLTIVCGDQTAIRGKFSENIGNQHSEKLVGAAELLLEKSGLKLSDVGLAGVVTGPGSFTGLRVGISFVKGLAMALGIKTIGLNTLDALAHAASGLKATRVSPMIDARRGQVYAALYNVENDSCKRISDYTAAGPEDWMKMLPNNTLLYGSGTETYQDLIKEQYGHLKLLEKNIASPCPESLYKMTVREMKQGNYTDPEDLDAFYIRQADAVCKPKMQ